MANDILKIKLIGIKNITDMSYIFHNCNLLVNISHISRLNTDDITNIDCIFEVCSSLLST